MKQIKNFHKQIPKKEYLNSYNFARRSNKVFAETISPNQFKELNLLDGSYEIYQQNDKYLTYRLKKIDIQDGDIIFCKTDFIFELFCILSRISKKINITLITHQAAQPSIGKSLFLMKPKCIQNWFSINVNYNHPNLIPIPLGISNDYSSVGIKIDGFKSMVNKLDFQKDKLAYLNFSSKNNFEKRKKIINNYENQTWVHKNFDTSEYLYMEEVANSKYIFTPPGWGIDTHRFWEALYLGSIPIVEHSINTSMFKIYPILIYDTNKLISGNELLNKYENLFSSFDFDKLTVSWWFTNIIQSTNKSSDNSISLKYTFGHKVLKRILKIKYKFIKLIHGQ